MGKQSFDNCALDTKAISIQATVKFASAYIEPL